MRHTFPMFPFASLTRSPATVTVDADGKADPAQPSDTGERVLDTAELAQISAAGSKPGGSGDGRGLLHSLRELL